VFEEVADTGEFRGFIPAAHTDPHVEGNNRKGGFAAEDDPQAAIESDRTHG
jgi:hypothetical protein